ncbi:hypothetical protein Tco_0585066 [Tanacetum coccineum]
MPALLALSAKALPDFMKCKPLYFKGTEGVVGCESSGLKEWKLCSLLARRHCGKPNQSLLTVLFLECVLTWWKTTYSCWFTMLLVLQNDLNKPKKDDADKVYPRGEIKKLKVEMWNLKVKGTDVVGYNQRFQELALMCARMFPEESDKFEKYVGGLPDLIHRSESAATNNQRNLTCYECGIKGHYKSDVPELKEPKTNEKPYMRYVKHGGMGYDFEVEKSVQDPNNSEDEIRNLKGQSCLASPSDP